VKIDEIVDLIEKLAQDAADCPEENCGDHDVPIEVAVRLVDMLPDLFDDGWVKGRAWGRKQAIDACVGGKHKLG
jgi:hypothetical protein